MIVIVEKNKDGKIELTEEQLNQLLEDAKEEGRKSIQQNSFIPDPITNPPYRFDYTPEWIITSPYKPYIPYYYNSPTCTGTATPEWKYNPITTTTDTTASSTSQSYTINPAFENIAKKKHLGKHDFFVTGTSVVPSAFDENRVPYTYTTTTTGTKRKHK